MDDCWDHVDSTPAAILAPYQRLPSPSPSQSPRPHPSQTPVILGTVFGVAIALVALSLVARYANRRRRSAKRRLSDESWVSGSVHSHSSRRKLVPVTTPECTPSDSDFGSRLDAVPTVRVPSPVYIPPFSPSPSLSSSSSSIEPLTHTARLSRLLSSTFGPARPTTAHLIQTARKYAEAYRPLNTNSTSLYTPPCAARFDGTRSRTSFYPVRDTISTVSTSDTDTDIPHLRGAVADPENPPSAPVGLKLRLSDASEHARYRLCERQRERERQVFKLRDSEEVLRERGW